MNIDELLHTLKGINETIDDLNVQRYEIESQIISLLGCEIEGQKTERSAKYKFVVRGNVTYKIDELLAQNYRDIFSEELNPIVSVTKYKVDVKKYNKLKMYPDMKFLADEFITKNVGSMKITGIEEIEE